MHPYAVHRESSLGAHADEKRHSGRVTDSTVGTRHALTTATPASRNALLSPRRASPRALLTSAATSRRESQQNTPLSSRTVKTAGAITPRREKLTSTLAHRTGTSSTLVAAAVTSAAHARSRSSSLPRAADSPQQSGEQERRSTPYQAPPAHTASSLERRKVRRAASRTETGSTPSQQREGNGSGSMVNESFAELLTPQRTPNATSEPGPGSVHGTASSVRTRGDVKNLPHALRAPAEPTQPHRRLSTPLLSTEDQKRGATVSRDKHCSYHSPTAACKNTPAVAPPHPFDLPRCSDDDLRRLFHVLLSYESSDCGLWSLRQHLLPFIAAHVSDILPVASDELLALLGDPLAAARCCNSTSKNNTSAFNRDALPDTRNVSAKTVSRFASELCSWFFCVGALGGGDALSWQAALSHENDDGDVSGMTFSQAAPSHCDHSVPAHVSTPVKQPVDGLPSSPGGSPEAPPRFVQPESSAEEAGEVKSSSEKNGDEDGETSLKWHSHARQTLSVTQAAGASSTFASLDFHSVVDVPPFVSAAAFARGWRVLHRLLTESALETTSATGEKKEGRIDYAQQLRAAVCDVGPSIPRPTAQLAKRENDHYHTQSHLLLLHVPAYVRVGLRRAQFYVRLHAFMRILLSLRSAAEATPSLRDAQLLQSVVRSRLYTLSTPLAVTGKGTKRSGDLLPRAPSLFARHALQRRLHSAISSYTPAASAHTVQGGPAVDTLDVLLMLRSREAERVVRRAVNQEVGDESFEKGPALAPVHRTLPASLLLLFALPAWTPWWAAEPSGRANVVRLCVFVTTLLLTLSFGPLLFFVARCLEPDWLPWWDAKNPRPEVDMELLLHGAGQVVVLTSVALLTSLLGRSRGAMMATLDVQQQLIGSQTARLTSTASTWLYSAWALRKENNVAATAAQRCFVRLALACRAAEATVVGGVPSTLRVSCLRAFGGSLLSVLLGTLLETYLPQRCCVTWTGLSLLVVVTWRSVTHAWRRRSALLAWWLQCQTSLAEGFARDLLRAVAAREGWAMACVDVDGHSSFRPIAAPAMGASTLCIMPLPFLEELVKVGQLIDACRRGGGHMRETSGRASPLTVQRLADFPRQCFWDQLCGHAAVAYTSGDTPAVSVVSRVATAAAALEEEVLAKVPSSSPQSPAVPLLSRLLPWAIEEAAVHRDSEEAHMYVVMAPVLAAVAQLQEGGSAELPASLDVRMRRCSYLSAAQQRLLVCAAVVFAALGMPAPHTSGAPGTKGEGETCVTETTMLCLVHLVYAQMTYTQRGVTPAVRWRDAVRRMREALRLVQRVTTTKRLSCGTDSASTTGAIHYALLPQLHHVLFA